MQAILDVDEPLNRFDFGGLLSERGYRKAIEIGTDLGTFACALLDKWHGELMCVDDYAPYEWNRWSREADMIVAATRLARYQGRGRIVQCKSVELAETLPKWFTEQLDFVYIDAAHDFANVLTDCQTWWPLITDIGMLAGHDFDEKLHPEVYSAVRQFAEVVKRDIHVVRGDGHCFSWYLEKNSL